jgi:ABC-type Na+ efflux pump permease subunit
MKLYKAKSKAYCLIVLCFFYKLNKAGMMIALYVVGNKGLRVLEQLLLALCPDSFAIRKI